MRAKFSIQNIDNAGAGKLGSAVDDTLEVTPEQRQKVGPCQLAVGYFIQLVFQLCSEVIFNIAFKEVCQEGRHQPSTVLWNEFAAVFHDIAAIKQGLDCRCVC